MKLNTSHHSRLQAGIALILVLGAVAMIAMLVVAFLATARTEQRSATAFSDAVDARNLSELPINMAIGQIRRATEQLTHQKTWSSQPGMLRVYGVESDSTTGGFRSTTVALHKLYTDETMVVTNSGATATSSGKTTQEIKIALDQDVSELAQWQAVPGRFVDMNEPAPVVTAGSSKLSIQFPIADPRALFARGGGKGVEGFDFAGRAGGTMTTSSVPGTVEPKSVDDVSARLPMPVKWLYVLADGRVVAPTGGTAEQGLEFAAADRPTAQNPITGRVAFWADDDTCKVNINTATEGVPWDMPRANSNAEMRMAKFMPAQNEFSRYPGHPAQTCLSPVFQMFGSEWVVDHTLAASSTDSQRAQAVERYMNLNPRMAWGGSKAGTEAVTNVLELKDAQGRMKDGRLYANLDEVVFTRDRQAQTPTLTHQDITKGRFFLTAHSRAPEINLLNKSRIMLWPVSATAAERNAKDKLLAYLGTTGMGAFYLQRGKNFKSDTDPGTSQDPEADYNIQRNKDMLEGVLRHYMGNTEGGFKVPGFGGNFATKWGQNRRNQIITEMFDFVRWSVNGYSTAEATKYHYLPARAGDLLGETSAVPVVVGDTKGFGRWPTITEAAIVFVATAPEQGGTTTQMQAYIILEPFSPTAGPPSWSANVKYRIRGLNQFQVDGASMGFTEDGTLLCNRPTGWIHGGHATPFTGLGQQFKRAKAAGVGGADAAKDLSQTEGSGFPFFSIPINVAGKQKFDFKGGEITIDVMTGWWGTTPSKRVQTLKLHFPNTRLKVPRMVDVNFNSLPKRFAVAGGDYMKRLIMDGDTTRSVEIRSDGPAGGDLRMVNLMDTVPSDWFTTHPKYTDENVELLHFLRNSEHGYGGQYGGKGSNDTIGDRGGRPNTHLTAGTLLKGTPYCRDTAPIVPRGLNGAFKADGRPGDWDNGVGKIPDGALINKTDDANLATDAEGGYFSFGSFKVEDGKTFSPNRQIASAVAFGSLSSGVSSSKDPASVRPWQTLLFCPNPASRTSAPIDSSGKAIEPTVTDHEGFKAPRDHLLLDLFWMPVAEPYAISEEFSTAGKINMNYEMMPFRHIERSTGIHAAMKPVSMLAITPESVKALGDQFCSGHKSGHHCKEGTIHAAELRYLVDTKTTLKGFAARFAAGDAFRSASEICEIFLVPKRAPLPAGYKYNTDAEAPPTDYSEMTRWWNGDINKVDAFDATGDNSREAPYNQLYPRLTTKSNTYTLHYRVQMLKKARSTDPARWVEGKDSVLSEYRGSAVLERFMDPNDKEILLIGQGYGDTNNFSNHYRMRVIERKQFAP